MSIFRLAFLINACFVCYATFAQTDSTTYTHPDTSSPPPVIALSTLDISLEPSLTKPTLLLRNDQDGMAEVEVDGKATPIQIENGVGRLEIETSHEGRLMMIRAGGEQRLIHVAELSSGGFRFRNIPLWLSILPPLIAIALALIFKEVIISLFIGVWAGAFIVGGLRFESLYYCVLSFFNTISRYVIAALNDSSHLSVIVFSLLIGGMVSLISKNGGMAGVVLKLSRYARSSRSSQLVTWFLGIAIFFDDYANTLIVGTTMRPVTDRFRVSREKLAYLVDSTAAPVAAIAFVTTWIGAELGYIESGLEVLRDFPFEMTPYAMFVSSLKYAFYPVLTILFMLMLIYMGRDYGPMLAAEQRARHTGRVSKAMSEAEDEPNMEDLGPVKGAPLRWFNAVIPVALVVFVTIYGLVQTGMQATYAELLEKGVAVTSSHWGQVWNAMPALFTGEEAGFFHSLGKVIGNADSFQALLWASLSGATVAILLTISQRIIKLFDTMHYLTMGFKTMLPAIIILTFAWALASTTGQLHTAEYLTQVISGSVNPHFMPAIIFVLAAAISFSTGSSWSTMAILYPIAIPTTWAVCLAGNLPQEQSLEILLNVVATVMSASVVGDHCSPISDTTILSSLASDCNHIDHVKTQMPYAITVASVSLIVSFIATYYGGGWGISAFCLLLSLVVLFLVIWKLGKQTHNYAP